MAQFHGFGGRGGNAEVCGIGGPEHRVLEEKKRWHTALPADLKAEAGEPRKVKFYGDAVSKYIHREGQTCLFFKVALWIVAHMQSRSRPAAPVTEWALSSFAFL